MRVFRGLTELAQPWRNAVMAIGNFDGLHLGHRSLVDRAFEAALPESLPVGLITFEPHPKQVIAPATAPARLSPMRRKLELARDLNIDLVVVLPFSKRLMQTPAEAFVSKILSDRLGISGLIAGEDFRFGQRRSGDMQMLRRMGPELGIAVHSMPAFQIDGVICSSSSIRSALGSGDVAKASRFLGYDYEIEGVVRSGERRGRQLGFPTANTYPIAAATAMPATGIYTVRASINGAPQGDWLDGVASLGWNPTFSGQEKRLEVHILDRSGLELYGSRLKVAFIERLRGEVRFETIDALVAQMQKDCDQARRTHRLIRRKARQQST